MTSLKTNSDNSEVALGSIGGEGEMKRKTNKHEDLNFLTN